jgi:hypothetical protein
MKLRIRGNSIRFRLTQAETVALATKGRVEETIQFTASPNDQLTYVVQTSPLCSEVRAWRSPSEVGVTLPANLAHLWTSTDQVGIERSQAITQDVTLQIVVEKDFRCLQPKPGEDESDNFPNPEEPSGSHNSSKSRLTP